MTRVASVKMSDIEKSQIKTKLDMKELEEYVNESHSIIARAIYNNPEIIPEYGYQHITQRTLSNDSYYEIRTSIIILTN